MRIAIDREVCVGTATCVAVASEVFGIDKDKLAYLLTDDVDDVKGEVEQAVDMCPVGALRIVE